MKTVSQILETKGSTIYSVAPESLVYDALLIMAEHHIGAWWSCTGTRWWVFSQSGITRVRW